MSTKESESTSKTISKILKATKKTLHVSSIHSFPNIVRNEFYSIKAMWFVCLLASSSYCSYSIYEAVLNYNNNEVISTTREDYENPMSFPTITLCNMNFFSTNYSKAIMHQIYNESSMIENKNYSRRLNFYNYRSSAVSYAYYLQESQRNQLGLSLDQIIISCMFNNKDCNLKTDFEPYFDPLYGNCFKYNLAQNKYLSVSGSSIGLRLELLNDAASSNKNLFSMYNGFFVFITNQTSFNSFDFDGVKVPNGYTTSIILSKYSISRQPKPYSDCTEDLKRADSYPSVSYKKSFISNNNTYKRNYCLNICFQLYMAEKCGCYDTKSGPFPTKNTRPCLNANDQLCNSAKWTEFLEKNLFKTCDCPYECEKTDYSYTTSMADYPTKFYANYLLSNKIFLSKIGGNASEITYAYLRRRIASVNIFFNKLQQTVIKEDPKQTTTDLISIIGGILALFLGVSFLSFIEIVEITLQSIYIILENKNFSFKEVIKILIKKITRKK